MKVTPVVLFASSIMAAVTRAPNGAPAVDAQKRDDNIKVLCGAPPGNNEELPAEDYSYPFSQLLKAGDKRLHIDAGPRVCKQASCSQNTGAGVVVCNDKNKAVDLAYSDIAWFAQRVYETCKRRHNDGNDYVGGGQAFNPDDWNVILTDVGKGSACTAPNPAGSN